MWGWWMNLWNDEYKEKLHNGIFIFNIYFAIYQIDLIRISVMVISHIPYRFIDMIVSKDCLRLLNFLNRFVIIWNPTPTSSIVMCKFVCLLFDDWFWNVFNHKKMNNDTQWVHKYGETIFTCSILCMMCK